MTSELMATIPMSPMLPLTPGNVKDSRWLTLEVCREFQRSKCSRNDEECKFAHPPPHVEVQQGRVTCCFDAIKGKCQRKEPPCKYLHPPQHLREQVLQSGKNNLIMKNLQQQTMLNAIYNPAGAVGGVQPATVVYDTMGKPLAYPTSSPTSVSMPGQLPTMMNLQSSYTYPAHPAAYMAAVHPYMTQPVQHTLQSLQAQEPPIMPGNVLPTTQSAMSAATSQKVTRADRLEVCREYQRGTCTRQPSECRYAHPPESVTIDTIENTVTVCMDHIKGKCTRESCRYFHPPEHLKLQVKATQQRANAAAAQAALQPQVVEVITPGKKRALEPSADEALLLQAGMQMPLSMEQLYKRQAIPDKRGMPMYQPTTTSNAAMYQQAALQAAMLQQQQQQYLPVSCIYNGMSLSPDTSQQFGIYNGLSVSPDTSQQFVTGQPPGVPRF